MTYIEKTFGLNNKSVIMVGGGGTIALEISRSFLNAGAKVSIWSRREETVADTVNILSENNNPKNIYGHRVDSGDNDAVERALEETTEKIGQPQILINAVGGNKGKGTFTEIDVEKFQEILHLNLIAGLVVPSKCIAKFWMKNNIKGALINIASMASYVPISGVWAYNAAKAGVVNLTMATAKEFAPYGIRVNAIAPGFVVANQNRKLLIKDDRTGELTERGQQIIDHTPFKRFGTAEEMAGATLFLASNAASGFITGTTIPIDGGYLIDNV